MTFSTDQSETEGAGGDVVPEDLLECRLDKKAPSRQSICKYCKARFRRKDSLDRHVFHHTNQVTSHPLFALHLEPHSLSSHLCRKSSNARCRSAQRPTPTCPICGAICAPATARSSSRRQSVARSQAARPCSRRQLRCNTTSR